MYIELCEKIIDIINLAVKTTWNLRRQYIATGYRCLNEMFQEIQNSVEEIISIAGQEFIQEIQLAMLLEAQEMQDEILIADILEGQLIPTLESIIQQIEMNIPIEDIDYLEKNLLILEQNGHDELALELRKTEGYVDCRYIPEYTSSGQITICLEEQDQRYYISGNNNPYKDALDFVHDNMNENKYQYSLLGVGMMYEAQLILEERKDARVVVIEEDLYLLRMALKYRDISEVISDKRFSIMVGDYVNQVSDLNIEENELLIRKPNLRHMRDESKRFMLERIFWKMMSAKEKDFILQKNFRDNIFGVSQPESVDLVLQRFKRKTVYYIGGGPSLDESIEILRKRKSDSIVLCSGTSAARLRQEGITPEFVIITDPSACVEHQIKGQIEKNKTELLYLCSSSSEAVGVFDGKKYAIFQKGFHMAESYAKKNGYTLFSTGGSVSTTALDVCIRSECRRVICIGLDLAYTSNKSHASGTRSEREILSTRNPLVVKSVDGEMVQTSLNLSCFHRWIEERIKDVNDIEMINISNGAYIHGMKNILISDYVI